MAFIEITPKRGKASSKLTKDAITLAVHKSGRDTSSLVFKVPRKIAEGFRWKDHDRIRVHFDSKNPMKFLLQRTNSGGFSLSPTHKGGASSFVISLSLPDTLKFQLNDRFFCLEMTEPSPGDVQVVFEKIMG